VRVPDAIEPVRTKTEVRTRVVEAPAQEIHNYMRIVPTLQRINDDVKLVQAPNRVV
jgi:hypothetical protein